MAGFASLALSLPMFLVGFVISLVATGAATHAVALYYLGEEIDVGESYRQAFSRAWVLIAAAVLFGLGLAGAGILIFIIIGIPLVLFLAVSWAFYEQAVMIEGDGPTASLGRSYNLVRGSRWRVLGIATIYWLILIGAGILITIFSAIIGVVSGTVGVVASGVGLVLLTPVAPIGLTVVYFDLRVRKEGFTLGTLSSQLRRTSA